MSAGPIRRFFEFSLTGSRATSEVEVLLGKGVWNLDYHGFTRTAGGSATYQPSLSETSGETSGALSERARLNYGAAIAVATITRDQLDPGVPFQCNPDADGNGKLYYKPHWAGGSSPPHTDNTATVVLVFTKCLGAVTTGAHNG